MSTALIDEFCNRWRRLFGADAGCRVHTAPTGYVYFGPGEVLLTHEHVVEAWVGSSAHVLCHVRRGLSALVELPPSCSFDEAYAALIRTNAVLDAPVRARSA